MKPQEGPDIERTLGDTIPISILCKILSDSGTAVVPDAATVKFQADGPTTAVISGAAKGDASGTFLFDPADINSWPAGTYEYEVEVHDGTYEQTIGYGNLVLRDEIA